MYGETGVLHLQGVIPGECTPPLRNAGCRETRRSLQVMEGEESLQGGYVGAVLCCVILCSVVLCCAVLSLAVQSEVLVMFSDPKHILTGRLLPASCACA